MEKEKKDFIFKQSSYKPKKEYFYLFKLKYQIKKEEKFLKIFGKSFVKRNKVNCLITYKNRYYELKEYFDNIDIDTDIHYKTESSISIKLRIINNIFNASKMFEECNSLLDILIINNSEIKSNKFNIINISGLFYGCKWM